MFAHGRLICQRRAAAASLARPLARNIASSPLVQGITPMPLAASCSRTRSLFAKADRNGDGFVDMSEFRHFVSQHGLTLGGRNPIDVFGDFGQTRWHPLDQVQFERLLVDADVVGQLEHAFATSAEFASIISATLGAIEVEVQMSGLTA
jgi:hypothetical protein